MNKLYSVHINESGFFLCMFGLRRHLGFDDWYGLEILQNQKLIAKNNDDLREGWRGLAVKSS